MEIYYIHDAKTIDNKPKAALWPFALICASGVSMPVKSRHINSKAGYMRTELAVH